VLRASTIEEFSLLLSLMLLSLSTPSSVANSYSVRKFASCALYSFA